MPSLGLVHQEPSNETEQGNQLPSFHDVPVGGIALIVAAVAGLVRGFSGFGSALVLVPIISALYGVRTAVTTMVLIDVAAGFWIAMKAWQEANLSEVASVLLAAILGIPIGLAILVYADTFYIRWVMALFVIVVVFLMAAGRWHYRGMSNKLLIGVAGLAAGIFGTAFQMDGPPAVLLWLGSDKAPSTVRGNTAVFLECTGALIIAAYAIKGWISYDVIATAFYLFWPFLAGAVVGTRRFRGTSEKAYRWTAYGLISLSAIVSLPIFDTWLR